MGVAKKYSTKFQSSIAMGHQHHSEQGYDLSGTHQCLCVGGSVDSTKLGYLHYQPRVNPVPTRSFAIIKEGYGLIIPTHDADLKR